MAEAGFEVEALVGIEGPAWVLPDLNHWLEDPTIGSLSVVKGLLEARMGDRLRLTVFPQILGSTGRESVFASLLDIDLELLDTNVLDGRLVTLEYHPATAHQTD